MTILPIDVEKELYSRTEALRSQMEGLYEEIDILESCGADAIQALKICLSNPNLTPGQQAVVREALDKMFSARESWHSNPRLTRNKQKGRADPSV